MHDDLLQLDLLKREKKAASFVMIGEPISGCILERRTPIRLGLKQNRSAPIRRSALRKPPSSKSPTSTSTIPSRTGKRSLFASSASLEKRQRRCLKCADLTKKSSGLIVGDPAQRGF